MVTAHGSACYNPHVPCIAPCQQDAPTGILQKLYRMCHQEEHRRQRNLIQSASIPARRCSANCADHACRGSERGTARPEVLQSLLATTDRVVQEIDSVEYGLTDIQVGASADTQHSGAQPINEHMYCSAVCVLPTAVWSLGTPV